MAILCAISLIRILAITFTFHQAWSLPHTPSPTTNSFFAVYSEPPCYNTTSTSPKLPDPTFLSTTTFGVLSIIIAFGSLVVGIVGILQYRRYKTIREADNASPAPPSQPDPIHPSQQSPAVRYASYDSDASPPLGSPVLSEAVVSTSLDLSSIPCDTTAIGEVPAACTTSARLNEEDSIEQVQVESKSAVRPVHQLRFRNSVRHSRKDEDGFGGAYRTFTF